jgi:hypothetical protein
MRTTHHIALQQAAPDLLERNFAAGVLDRSWVADIIHIHSKEGFVYPAFGSRLGASGSAGSSKNPRATPSSAGDAL